VDIFPDVPLEEVHRRTAERWSFDGPWPMPKGDWLCCPICRSKEVQGRSWIYDKPSHSVTTPYRCSVSFKCTDCGYVFLFGLVMTQEDWERHAADRANKRVRWRNVLRDMERGD
jgi:hypothetical protein